MFMGPPNLAAALSLRVIPMQLASLAKRLISAPVLVAAVALTGCAHTLRHDVTVFHDWPGAGLERTYRFERKPGQQDSLKYTTYQRIIAEELRAAGFVPGENPNLAISFDYVTKPRYVRYIDSGPVFTPYLGIGAGGRRSSFYFSAPLWGWPYRSYDYELERHQRVLSLEISDLHARPIKKIYEATATSSGSEPAMVAALPLLMRAVLADFPGRSGIARQVDINLDEQQTPQSAPVPAPPSPAK